jgi:hypothetical protein
VGCFLDVVPVVSLCSTTGYSLCSLREQCLRFATHSENLCVLFPRISELATAQLSALHDKLAALAGKNLDSYSQAHFQAAQRRIQSALEARVLVR